MAQITNVDVEEAIELVEGGALLLDVREDSEWELGHAPQAVHISLSEVPDHVDELDKSRRIVCICRSGGRSSRVGQFLVDQGFDVVNLDGGITAWAEQGKPLVADGGAPAVG